MVLSHASREMRFEARIEANTPTSMRPDVLDIPITDSVQAAKSGGASVFSEASLSCVWYCIMILTMCQLLR